MITQMRHKMCNSGRVAVLDILRFHFLGLISVMFGSDMQFFSIVIMFNGQTALFSKLTNLKKNTLLLIWQITVSNPSALDG